MGVDQNSQQDEQGGEPFVLRRSLVFQMFIKYGKLGWVLVVLWVDIVQIAEIMVAASPAGSTRPAFHAIALLRLPFGTG